MKSWKERRGQITQLCDEMMSGGTRKYNRNQARLFKKYPLKYSDYCGMEISKRGVVLDAL